MSGVSSNPKLQRYLESAQERARAQQLIFTLTDRCWNKCVAKVGARLDDITSQCVFKINILLLFFVLIKHWA